MAFLSTLSIVGGMGVAAMYLLRSELAQALRRPRRYPVRLEVQPAELDRMAWEGGISGQTVA